MKIQLLLFTLLLSLSARGEVIIQPTPDQGLQPRLGVAADGAVHLLYFKKRINSPSAREGNLYYRQFDPARGTFGLPVRVSSQAFAMQTFSIARHAMAIGGDGRVHVLWYLPRESRFLYSRSNPERTAFEPLRSMVADYAVGIDAGGEIAASGSEVAVIWGAGELSREDERSMFARFSHDNGATFGKEMMISNPDLGACACCSMAAEYLDENDLMVAYRSAIDGIGRHMQLLTLENADSEISGASYREVHELQQWEVSFCPLSTNDITIDPAGNRWLVFETESRIMQLNLSSEGSPSRVGEPLSETRQKNPAVAVNGNGERLVVWGEAISHARGGILNLRLFDASGKVTDFRSEELEIQQYSYPAAAALPNGDFLVLH